jgi:hypothetical protein
MPPLSGWKKKGGRIAARSYQTNNDHLCRQSANPTGSGQARMFVVGAFESPFQQYVTVLD